MNPLATCKDAQLARRVFASLIRRTEKELATSVRKHDDSMTGLRTTTF